MASNLSLSENAVKEAVKGTVKEVVKGSRGGSLHSWGGPRREPRKGEEGAQQFYEADPREFRRRADYERVGWKVCLLPGGPNKPETAGTWAK